eukprot:2699596-Amphidinium_carterae.1
MALERNRSGGIDAGGRDFVRVRGHCYYKNQSVKVRPKSGWSSARVEVSVLADPAPLGVTLAPFTF